MKVLYISNFFDSTGWSHAAIDYVLALDSIGVDVTCRNIKLNDKNGEVPEKLWNLLNKKHTDYDIVIQQVLPHMMDYNGRVKNVGLFFSETSGFPTNNWTEKLNCMDAVIVSTKKQENVCLLSGINTKTFTVPVPCDINKYTKYPALNIPKDGFVFYFIGELSRRKNISALIKAFHCEFDKEEPVSLLLKLSGNNNPDIIANQAGNLIEEIKKGLKIYPEISDYKKEIIITDHCSDADIMSIHSSCDCFVMPSYGEGWNIPAFDALAMGNTPIYTSFAGMDEYLDISIGYPVDSQEDIMFGMFYSIPGIYTAKETGRSICIPKLQRAMREAYTEKEIRKIKSENGINSIYKYSYENVGKKFKRILENI